MPGQEKKPMNYDRPVKLGPNDYFIGACIEIDELLVKLRAIRNEHFGVDTTQQRNWAEVGTASEVARLLRRAHAFATGSPD